MEPVAFQALVESWHESCGFPLRRLGMRLGAKRSGNCSMRISLREREARLSLREREARLSLESGTLPTLMFETHLPTRLVTDFIMALGDTLRRDIHHLSLDENRSRSPREKMQNTGGHQSVGSQSNTEQELLFPRLFGALAID